MSVVMAYLAETYKIWIGVISGVFIATYILISVLGLVKRYKYFKDVPLAGVFPLYHIRYLFSKGRKAKEDKIAMSKEVIEDMF
jgi:hypothetical protein